jgi:hypothetical protein
MSSTVIEIPTNKQLIEASQWWLLLAKSRTLQFVMLPPPPILSHLQPTLPVKVLHAQPL